MDAEESNVIDRPTMLRYGGGRLVESYALLDKGNNPLEYFTRERNVMRKSLGDIRFMGRHDVEDKLMDLMFVPEYPSGEFRSLRSVMTFYGILLNQKVEEPIIEIRAWDLSYRHLEWTAGMSVLKTLDRRAVTQTQAKIIDAVLELDEVSRIRTPNCTAGEMRRIVGVPTGARISVMPLAFGLV
jgi:hypothetical protein